MEEAPIFYRVWTSTLINRNTEGELTLFDVKVMDLGDKNAGNFQGALNRSIRLLLQANLVMKYPTADVDMHHPLTHSPKKGLLLILVRS
jgi:hypothetical protein